MKQTTALKIMRRYMKGLEVMEKESIAQGNKTDADLYRMDKNAFEYVVKKLENLERSNA